MTFWRNELEDEYYDCFVLPFNTVLTNNMSETMQILVFKMVQNVVYLSNKDRFLNSTFCFHMYHSYIWTRKKL